MYNLYNYVDRKSWFLSILHATIYFLRIMCYRKLYVITSSINNDTDLSIFYYNTILVTSSVIFIEIINYIVYYKIKTHLNILVSNIFSNALSNLLRYKMEYIEKYD